MKTKRAFLEYALYFFVAVMILFFLLRPAQAAGAALEGFHLWLNNVMPALFPFFIVSALMANCGMMQRLRPVFEPFTRKVLGVSGCGAFAWLVSLFSGYPVGTKAVCELYQNGDVSKPEAQVLLTLCSNGGPVFVISTVGTLFFQNSTVAFLLFFCNYASAFLAGFLASRFLPAGGNHPSYSFQENRPVNYGRAFTRSVTDSVISVVNVGAFIVFFRVIIQVLSVVGAISDQPQTALNALSLFSSVLTAFLELTAGTKAFSMWASHNMPLAVGLSAMAVGFGGLCIFFQSLSFVSDTDLSVKGFFLGKLLQSAIGFVLGYGGALFFLKRDASCFAPMENLPQGLRHPLLFWAFLIIMGLCFLAAECLRGKKPKKKKEKRS